MSIKKLNLKLGAKFILSVVVILSITMGISAYYMHNLQSVAFLENQERQASVQASFVASISKEAILSHDYISLNLIVRELIELEDIVHSNFTSIQNQVMTTYVNKNDPNISSLYPTNDVIDRSGIEEKLSRNGNIFLYTQPIMVDDEKIANINIWVDKGHITELLNSSLYIQLVNMMAIILVMSAFIYLVFRTNVLLPVNNLMKGATQVAQGKLDSEVTVTATDELGTLANTFNTMMRNLKSSIQKRDQTMSELQLLNRHLEDRVQERTTRLELSQKIALMGQWDYHPGSRLIEVSDETRRILGLRPDDSVTRCEIMKRIYLDDRLKLIKSYLNAVKLRKPFKIELRCVPPDSLAQNIMLSARVEEKKDNIVLFGIIQDISEQKQTEASTRQALLEKSHAESANKAKSAFLANMSHEIRTPLTAVIGFSEVLLKNCSDAEQYESLTAIQKNGRHLLSLINEILDLSKIESNKLELDIVKVDVLEFFSELESVMKMQAANKNISFKLNYDYPLPQQIETDPFRVKQILYNLVNNAIKFTSEGYVRLNIGYDLKSSQLIVEVVDTGVGISQEKLKHLFSPFTQADSSTTRQYGGTGLGLYISKQLIEMLGGTINFESISGLGSKICFHIDTGRSNTTILAEKPAKNPNFTLPQDSETSKQTMEGNILLVDDNADNRNLVKTFLKQSGVEITIAENGKEALDVALNHEFDLVLMDIQMPIMDGVEATKQLRSAGYTVPIIALTANAMKQEQKHYLNAGCNDFIPKPIDQGLLLTTLAKYMRIDNVNSDTRTNINYDLLSLEREFIDGLPARAQAISKAQAIADFQLVETECHRLKGIAGVYGYNAIAKLASKIEYNLKQGQQKGVEIDISSLFESFQQADEIFSMKGSENKAVVNK